MSIKDGAIVLEQISTGAPMVLIVPYQAPLVSSTLVDALVSDVVPS